jgi:hypothetical protein
MQRICLQCGCTHPLRVNRIEGADCVTQNEKSFRKGPHPFVMAPGHWSGTDDVMRGMNQVFHLLRPASVLQEEPLRSRVLARMQA